MQVGIIGAGAIARVHATEWRKLPVTIAGVYDRNPPRAEAFCAQYGGRAFSSLDELLANVDIVTICTHTDGHRAAVEAAAAAGVAIVCEKPLARHLADGEAMVAACEAANIPLFVAQVVRFFPAYAQAQAQVAQGVIGRPGVIRTQRAGSYPAPGATFSSPFYADFARSGGVVLDLGIHDIDYHCWLGGEVERVFARGLTFRNVPNLDHAYISLRFASGAIGHIDASWALPPGNFRTRLEIGGDQGLIEWDSLQPAPLIGLMRDATHADQSHPFNANPVAPHDEPYYAQLAHFLTCLEMGQPFRVSARDALAALKIALAAIQSMQIGHPVEIATFQEQAQ